MKQHFEHEDRIKFSSEDVELPYCVNMHYGGGCNSWTVMWKLTDDECETMSFYDPEFGEGLDDMVRKFKNYVVCKENKSHIENDRLDEMHTHTFYLAPHFSAYRYPKSGDLCGSNLVYMYVWCGIVRSD